MINSKIIEDIKSLKEVNSDNSLNKNSDNILFNTFQFNLLNNGDFSDSDFFEIANWSKVEKNESHVLINQKCDGVTFKTSYSINLQNTDCSVGIYQKVKDIIPQTEYTVTVECSTENENGSKLEISFDSNEKVFDIPKTDKKIISFTGSVNSKDVLVGIYNVATKTNLNIKKVMFTNTKYSTTFNKSFKDMLMLNKKDLLKDINNKTAIISQNDKQARKEIQNLQLLLDKSKLIKDIDNKSGIGFYDLFKDNSNIDTNNSSINIENTDINFKGKQTLKFREAKYPNNIKNLELNLYDKKRESVEILSNKNNIIEVMTTPNLIFENNKIIIDGKIYNIVKMEVENG